MAAQCKQKIANIEEEHINNLLTIACAISDIPTGENVPSDDDEDDDEQDEEPTGDLIDLNGPVEEEDF